MECRWNPQVSRLLLRSMKQACYSVEGRAGHFGLAAEHYCHFTSPIRRYPDLQIHRIIKDVIRGRMGQERTHHYELLLDDVASKSSMLERRAEEVERETIKLKKAEYMSSHIERPSKASYPVSPDGVFTSNSAIRSRTCLHEFNVGRLLYL